MAWLAVLALVAGFLFWLDTLRARDLALAVARQQTARLGLQLLDDTVALQRVRIERTASGWLALARRFRFEFTETGDSRREGFVLLAPDRPPHVDIEAYIEAPRWH
ncbi:MAG: DUF3301 domain-containing protein [Burkholderiales bacterium]|jgi:hypothetical protein|nr:DUF3301 domain-containing protein [Betaproteobacteria bacterium]